MNEKIRKAFDSVKAEEELKETKTNYYRNPAAVPPPNEKENE